MALPADCKQLDQMDHRIGVSVAKRIAIDAGLNGPACAWQERDTKRLRGCAWLLPFLD